MLLFLFGIIAIIATFINYYLLFKRKDNTVAMAIALSFTALAVCAELSMAANWVIQKDFASLDDVIPVMSKALWFLTIVSILLNTFPIVLNVTKKNT